MEVVGDSVPVQYFDELSLVQRSATLAFALQLVIRLELVDALIESSEPPHGIDELRDLIGVADPNWDLVRYRNGMIADLGVDPLHVLSGPRPD